jgi:hypothetical protein
MGVCENGGLMSDTPTFDALARELKFDLGSVGRRSAPPPTVAGKSPGASDQSAARRHSPSHYPEARLLLEELRSGKWHQ